MTKWLTNNLSILQNASSSKDVSIHKIPSAIAFDIDIFVVFT
jgi:hypothetical protein